MRRYRPRHDFPLPSGVGDLDRVGSRELEERILAARARGVDVLALVGGPRLPLPDHIRTAALAAVDDPTVQPSRGAPELRDAVRRLFLREYGVALAVDENVVVTSGAMQALDVVFRTILEPGDNVVIPAPNFFFDGAVRVARAEPRSVRSGRNSSWRWDLDALESAIDARTRAIVFSNPTNPTGFMPSKEELEELCEIARVRNLLVVSDESYDKLVYDDAEFASIATVEGWLDCAVAVKSLSKSYALAPWRIGYVVASRELTEAFAKVFEWQALYASDIAQRVGAAAIDGPQDWLARVVEDYRVNRDVVGDALSECEWVSATVPSATPFFFVDGSRLLEHGVDPSDALLELGIPAVAGKYFGVPTHVRLSFGGKASTIESLVGRIQSISPDGRA